MCQFHTHCLIIRCHSYELSAPCSFTHFIHAKDKQPQKLPREKCQTYRWGRRAGAVPPVHDSHFALDIAIFVLHTELGPDENHDGKLCCSATCVAVLGAGAEIAPLACSGLAFRAVWALLGSPLNTRAAAPPSFPTSRSIRPRGVTELSPDPPISSRAAGDAGVLSALGEEPLALGRWSRGCCSLPFPSRDLFPEFFKADLSSHDWVHRVLFFFSFHRQNRHSYEKELISAVCPDKLQTEHTLLADGAPVLECHFCI